MVHFDFVDVFISTSWQGPPAGDRRGVVSLALSGKAVSSLLLLSRFIGHERGATNWELPRGRGRMSDPHLHGRLLNHNMKHLHGGLDLSPDGTVLDPITATERTLYMILAL